MSSDKQKLLHVIKSLEEDYKSGRISEDKFRYFHSKYMNKLKAMDATDRIRSMQGKPSYPQGNSNYKKNMMNKREDQRLVQKYIVNPKMEDNPTNNKSSKSKSISNLVLVLVLAIAFTSGIAYGVFSLDFEDMSVVNASTVVEDTAFPDIEIVNTTTVDNNSSDTVASDTVTDTQTDYESTPTEDTYSYSDSGSQESGEGSQDTYTQEVG